MFDNWKKRHAEARAKQEAYDRNEYAQRIDRSAHYLCGLSFSCHGPTLSVFEMRAILRRERDRVLEDLTNDR